MGQPVFGLPPGIIRAFNAAYKQAQCKKRQRAINDAPGKQAGSNHQTLEFFAMMIDITGSLQHAPRRKREEARHHNPN